MGLLRLLHDLIEGGKKNEKTLLLSLWLFFHFLRLSLFSPISFFVSPKKRREKNC